MNRDDNALTAEEVAEMLQISRSTVYNLVKAGALTSYSIGRKMRFTLADVEAYIATARNSSTEKVAALPTYPAVDYSRNGEHELPVFRISGNDLAADVVANYLGSYGLPIQRQYEGSYSALVNMYHQRVDAAVVHLYDRKTGKYNVPYVQRLLPGTPAIVIRLIKRRQGLLVARGNPKNLRSWDCFLRDDITMVNRERGAGTRVLLDEKLAEMEMGIVRPRGYRRELTSSLSQGSFVARGAADVCIGSERVYHQISGLDFLPLQDEYLDLVLAKTPNTQRAIAFIAKLSASRNFRDEFNNIVGYDTTSMGDIVYEV